MQGFLNFALKVAGALLLINAIGQLTGLGGIINNPLGAIGIGNRTS